MDRPISGYRELRPLGLDRPVNGAAIRGYREVHSINFDTAAKEAPEHTQRPFPGTVSGGDKPIFRGKSATYRRLSKSSVKKAASVEPSVQIEEGYEACGGAVVKKGECAKGPSGKRKDDSPASKVKSVCKVKSATDRKKESKLVLMPELKSVQSWAPVEPIDSAMAGISQGDGAGDPNMAKGKSSIYEKRRSPWAAREPKKRDSRRRCIFLVFGLLVVLAVGAAIAAAIYFTFPAKNKERAMLFYESVCSKESSKSQVSPKCVLGSPPTTGCQGDGTCTIFSYEIRLELNGSKTLVDKTRTRPDHSDSPLLCRYLRGGVYKLGTCSEGKCNQAHSGEEDPTWYDESTWEDNCDEPNPCWTDFSRPLLPKATVTREECKTGNAECQDSADAVVWMQHLRCKAGSNATTRRHCEGLPLRLWKCKHCSQARDICHGKPGCKATDCMVSQKGDDRFEPRHDGTKCKLRHSQDEAYCFSGTCFKAELGGPKKIVDKKECLKRR